MPQIRLLCKSGLRNEVIQVNNVGKSIPPLDTTTQACSIIIVSIPILLAKHNSSPHKCNLSPENFRLVSLRKGKKGIKDIYITEHKQRYTLLALVCGTPKNYGY